MKTWVARLAALPPDKLCAIASALILATALRVAGRDGADSSTIAEALADKLINAANVDDRS